ncbi:MAG: DNA polymerase IV [Puia sp.]|nr:DNA polymerase IV [Puia sp.]
MVQRKIIHIDMDAFYASVEQRDHPAYRGKPIAVGGSPEGRGGVVATASYEARKFGVRSAMPSRKARELCPQVIFVKPRFDAYQAASAKIREIFHRYTDLIEPLSLDEAYLDVTEDKQQIGSAIEIAKMIKQAIREELQLTASAGVSVNKFVAKIASDMNKPDGLTFIGPSRIESFIDTLPVERFFGVGRVTAEKMKNLDIHTGADIKKMTEADLVKYFGKTGRFYYQIARGIDDRPVQPHRETKSLAAEDTFPEDLTTPDEMRPELDKITQTVCRRLRRHSLKGRTITLKIKYSDFRQITRSRSLPERVDDPDTILAVVMELLLSTDPTGKKIRLLGVSLSNFDERRAVPGRAGEAGAGQLELF